MPVPQKLYRQECLYYPVGMLTRLLLALPAAGCLLAQSLPDDPVTLVAEGRNRTKAVRITEHKCLL